MERLQIHSNLFTLTVLMNVRGAPSASAQIVKVLHAGPIVEAAKVTDDWLSLTDGTYILYGGGKFAGRRTT